MERGRLESSKLSQGKQLSQNELQVETAAFEVFTTSLFAAKSGNKALPAAPQSLALQDLPETELDESQWGKAQEQLFQCLAAIEKLEKEGKKCLQDVGVDEKGDSLYQTLLLGFGTRVWEVHMPGYTHM